MGSDARSPRRSSDVEMRKALMNVRTAVTLRMVCWQSRVLLYLIGLAFICEIMRQLTVP